MLLGPCKSVLAWREGVKQLSMQMSGIFCNEDTEGNLLTWQTPSTT